MNTEVFLKVVLMVHRDLLRLEKFHLISSLSTVLGKSPMGEALALSYSPFAKPFPLYVVVELENGSQLVYGVDFDRIVLVIS